MSFTKRTCDDLTIRDETVQYIQLQRTDIVTIDQQKNKIHPILKNNIR